jgi:subtilisin family serine protease
MTPLDLTMLVPLMNLTSGRVDVKIGLIDGPVAIDHPEIAGEHVQEIAGDWSGSCTQSDSVACLHGTFVAGILSAKRGSGAPAICPDCTLLVRPIFGEAIGANENAPTTTPEQLAQAILDCIVAGAQVLNISAAVAQPSIQKNRALEEVLNLAVRREVLVIVAAGNQGTLGSTPITRHSWVIPVVACNPQGRPIHQSNLGNSIGRRGLRAPGDRITSLGANGKMLTSGGTSAAAPFVTGAIALLWSLFPQMTAAQMKLAITQAYLPRRTTVIPPLLDGWGSHQYLRTTKARRVLG